MCTGCISRLEKAADKTGVKILGADMFRFAVKKGDRETRCEDDRSALERLAAYLRRLPPGFLPANREEMITLLKNGIECQFSSADIRPLSHRAGG